MPGKKVSLSVRISQEDADYLASAPISGATTPSDKVRALIAEARAQSNGSCDSEGYRSRLDALTHSTRERLRKGEEALGLKSELVWLLLNWLSDAGVHLTSGPKKSDRVDQKDIEAFEATAADHVFRLFDGVLRLGVTARNPCYDQHAITKRLPPVFELVDVIRSSKTGEGNRKNV